MEEFVNGNLWLLLIKQSEQDKCFWVLVVIGREKWETIVFKIEKEGWPSHECYEEIDVFGLKTVSMAIG